MIAAAPTQTRAFPSRRPAEPQRQFTSPAVERVIDEVVAAMGDPELAWLFGNCFPNTLDTTVTLSEDSVGRPDTFVVTGDIDAMWLRDSTNQVWPYLPLMREDATLRRLVRGVIHRQAACVLLDPYANAFYADGSRESIWKNDRTDMRPGVHERKYELDSLCAFFRLSHGYHTETNDSSPFDADWLRACGLAIETIRAQQAGSDEDLDPPYMFQRNSVRPQETLALKGLGQPARRCGMSKSPFRPSDDAAMLPFLVPANAMAVVCLRNLAAVLASMGVGSEVVADARRLAEELEAGLLGNAVVRHPKYGEILAFELDGFGSHYLMDDANVPSLLSLPYLGYCDRSDPLYRRTRAFALSADNPYFSSGAVGRGVGGPHVGAGWIWPMSVIMQALTSDSDAEILDCIRLLKTTHGGTGFMHETFWKDDATRFTRPWFAWANALFGELIVTLFRERPHLLGRPVHD